MKLVSAIFILFFIFATKSSAAVFINEIAWMGTTASTTEDEWLELRNDGNESVDLENWTLVAQDGTPNIIFFGVNLKNKTIPANGYFLLERTDDQTLPSIVADFIYTGALSNGGETLILKDKNGGEIDRVNASSGWLAGDNANKLTMQKTSSTWITATGTPKSANAEQPSSKNSSSSSQASSSGNSSSQNSSAVSSSVGESIASGSVTYNYKNEQISAKAGEDKTAVAGADIVLEGSAYGFKKEPLENARYLWNLGDGSYKEGKNIRHIYKYPNDNYIAVLIVSSGDISATDRVKIKVIPNELVIIDAKNEFIKLKNKSGIILDVSGWFLKANGAVFKFPDYSLVAANSELMISSDISKLKFAGNNFSAEILYPNGSVVFSYSPSLLSFSSSKPKEIVLSKPPEKNTETATAVAMIISKKNSSNSSASSADKSLPAVEAGQNFATEKNLANVITIGEKNNPRTPIWLILAVITGIIGGAGVFLARKFTYTEK